MVSKEKDYFSSIVSREERQAVAFQLLGPLGVLYAVSIPLNRLVVCDKNEDRPDKVTETDALK